MKKGDRVVYQGRVGTVEGSMPNGMIDIRFDDASHRVERRGQNLLARANPSRKQTPIALRNNSGPIEARSLSAISANFRNLKDLYSNIARMLNQQIGFVQAQSEQNKRLKTYETTSPVLSGVTLIFLSDLSNFAEFKELVNGNFPRSRRESILETAKIKRKEVVSDELAFGLALGKSQARAQIVEIDTTDQSKTDPENFLTALKNVKLFYEVMHKRLVGFESQEDKDEMLKALQATNDDFIIASLKYIQPCPLNGIIDFYRKKFVEQFGEALTAQQFDNYFFDPVSFRLRDKGIDVYTGDALRFKEVRDVLSLSMQGRVPALVTINPEIYVDLEGKYALQCTKDSLEKATRLIRGVDLKTGEAKLNSVGLVEQQVDVTTARTVYEHLKYRTELKTKYGDQFVQKLTALNRNRNIEEEKEQRKKQREQQYEIESEFKVKPRSTKFRNYPDAKGLGKTLDELLGRNYAAWATRPDPVRVSSDKNSLCGNPIDGVAYYIVVDDTARPYTDYVTWNQLEQRMLKMQVRIPEMHYVRVKLGKTTTETTLTVPPSVSTQSASLQTQLQEITSAIQENIDRKNYLKLVEEYVATPSLQNFLALPEDTQVNIVNYYFALQTLGYWQLQNFLLRFVDFSEDRKVQAILELQKSKRKIETDALKKVLPSLVNDKVNSILLQLVGNNQIDKTIQESFLVDLGKLNLASLQTPSLLTLVGLRLKFLGNRDVELDKPEMIQSALLKQIGRSKKTINWTSVVENLSSTSLNLLFTLYIQYALGLIDDNAILSERRLYLRQEPIPTIIEENNDTINVLKSRVSQLIELILKAPEEETVRDSFVLDPSMIAFSLVDLEEAFLSLQQDRFANDSARAKLRAEARQQSYETKTREVHSLITKLRSQCNELVQVVKTDFSDRSIKLAELKLTLDSITAFAPQYHLSDLENYLKKNTKKITNRIEAIAEANSQEDAEKKAGELVSILASIPQIEARQVGAVVTVSEHSIRTEVEKAITDYLNEQQTLTPEEKEAYFLIMLNKSSVRISRKDETIARSYPYPNDDAQAGDEIDISFPSLARLQVFSQAFETYSRKSRRDGVRTQIYPIPVSSYRSRFIQLFGTDSARIKQFLSEQPPERDTHKNADIGTHYSRPSERYGIEVYRERGDIAVGRKYLDAFLPFKYRSFTPSRFGTLREAIAEYLGCPIEYADNLIISGAVSTPPVESRSLTAEEKRQLDGGVVKTKTYKRKVRGQKDTIATLTSRKISSFGTDQEGKSLLDGNLDIATGRGFPLINTNPFCLVLGGSGVSKEGESTDPDSDEEKAQEDSNTAYTETEGTRISIWYKYKSASPFFSWQYTNLPLSVKGEEIAPCLSNDQQIAAKQLGYLKDSLYRIQKAFSDVRSLFRKLDSDTSAYKTERDDPSPIRRFDYSTRSVLILPRPEYSGDARRCLTQMVKSIASLVRWFDSFKNAINLEENWSIYLYPLVLRLISPTGDIVNYVFTFDQTADADKAISLLTEAGINYSQSESNKVQIIYVRPQTSGTSIEEQDNKMGLFSNRLRLIFSQLQGKYRLDMSSSSGSGLPYNTLVSTLKSLSGGHVQLGCTKCSATGRNQTGGVCLSCSGSGKVYINAQGLFRDDGKASNIDTPNEFRKYFDFFEDNLVLPRSVGINQSPGLYDLVKPILAWLPRVVTQRTTTSTTKNRVVQDASINSTPIDGMLSMVTSAGELSESDLIRLLQRRNATILDKNNNVLQGSDYPKRHFSVYLEKPATEEDYARYSEDWHNIRRSVQQLINQVGLLASGGVRMKARPLLNHPDPFIAAGIRFGNPLHAPDPTRLPIFNQWLNDLKLSTSEAEEEVKSAESAVQKQPNSDAAVRRYRTAVAHLRQMPRCPEKVKTMDEKGIRRQMANRSSELSQLWDKFRAQALKSKTSVWEALEQSRSTPQTTVDRRKDLGQDLTAPDQLQYDTYEPYSYTPVINKDRPFASASAMKDLSYMLRQLLFDTYPNMRVDFKDEADTIVRDLVYMTLMYYDLGGYTLLGPIDSAHPAYAFNLIDRETHAISRSIRAIEEAEIELKGGSSSIVTKARASTFMTYNPVLFQMTKMYWKEIDSLYEVPTSNDQNDIIAMIDAVGRYGVTVKMLQSAAFVTRARTQDDFQEELSESILKKQFAAAIYVPDYTQKVLTTILRTAPRKRNEKKPERPFGPSEHVFDLNEERQIQVEIGTDAFGNAINHYEPFGLIWPYGASVIEDESSGRKGAYDVTMDLIKNPLPLVTQLKSSTKWAISYVLNGPPSQGIFPRADCRPIVTRLPSTGYAFFEKGKSNDRLPQLRKELRAVYYALRFVQPQENSDDWIDLSDKDYQRKYGEKAVNTRALLENQALTRFRQYEPNKNVKDGVITNQDLVVINRMASFNPPGNLLECLDEYGLAPTSSLIQEDYKISSSFDAFREAQKDLVKSPYFIQFVRNAIKSLETRLESLTPNDAGESLNIYDEYLRLENYVNLSTYKEELEPVLDDFLRLFSQTVENANPNPGKQPRNRVARKPRKPRGMR